MPTSSPKPYRVYRQRRPVRGDGAISWGDELDGGGRRRGRGGLPRRGFRLLRRILVVALALVLVWAIVAFSSFRNAVDDRNDALPEDVRATLAPADGPALVDDHVTLLVGADASAYRTREGERPRADTLILMRVDVPSRSVSMLSIPRDLYVEVPGYGEEKINSAYFNGGLALSVKTVRNLTGVEVNHVAQIDFDGFREVVDALDGIHVDNPTLLQSSQPFDGDDWTFRKGRILLRGNAALAYARMRHTTDERESTDLARARRQQRVIDAIVGEVASLESVRRPRDVPRAVVAPLLTDISAGQMIAFGFGKWWSKPANNLRCRLGGDQAYRNEQDVLLPNEDNRAVVRMWQGKQAPVAPEDPLSAGCVAESA